MVTELPVGTLQLLRTVEDGLKEVDYLLWQERYEEVKQYKKLTSCIITPIILYHPKTQPFLIAEGKLM